MTNFGLLLLKHVRAPSELPLKNVVGELQRISGDNMMSGMCCRVWQRSDTPATLLKRSFCAHRRRYK